MNREEKTALADELQERGVTAEEIRGVVEAGLRSRPEGIRNTLQEELDFYEDHDPEYAEKLKAVLGIEAERAGQAHFLNQMEGAILWQNQKSFGLTKRLPPLQSKLKHGSVTGTAHRSRWPK